MKKDERAQVSVEYLLTIMFAIVLVIAVTVIAFNITTIADRAQKKIIENQNSAISTIMS
ncbi:MAG TPA: hypothetical protein VJG83_06085 [archaeon]|nr:hypothetical protein [archaeon]